MVDFVDRGCERGDPADRLHALRGPGRAVRPGLPGAGDPDHARGVVQQADPSRCIGCRNCVYACPFGVPKFDVEARLMKKCNLCYDRTVAGPEAVVRAGLPDAGALVRRLRGVRRTSAGPRGAVRPLRRAGGADAGLPRPARGRAASSTSWRCSTRRAPSSGTAGRRARRHGCCEAARTGASCRPIGASGAAQVRRWRAEFPYHWDADDLVSRRELLRFAVWPPARCSPAPPCWPCSAALDNPRGTDGRQIARA